MNVKEEKLNDDEMLKIFVVQCECQLTGAKQTLARYRQQKCRGIVVGLFAVRFNCSFGLQ